MAAFSETYGLTIGIVVAILFVVLLVVAHLLVRKDMPTSTYKEAYKLAKEGTRQYRLMPIVMLFADIVAWISFRNSFPLYALLTGTAIVDLYMLLLIVFGYEQARLARKRLHQLKREGR